MTDTEPAYILAIAAPISAIVKHLVDSLGAALTAHTAGGVSPDLVGAWAMERGYPSSYTEHFLREAFHVYGLIENADGADTARAWFIGLNPMLGDEAPATAIRNGRAKDVLVAARSFLVTS